MLVGEPSPFSRHHGTYLGSTTGSTGSMGRKSRIPQPKGSRRSLAGELPLSSTTGSLRHLAGATTTTTRVGSRGRDAGATTGIPRSGRRARSVDKPQRASRGAGEAQDSAYRSSSRDSSSRSLARHGSGRSRNSHSYGTDSSPYRPSRPPSANSSRLSRSHSRSRVRQSGTSSIVQPSRRSASLSRKHGGSRTGSTSSSGSSRYLTGSSTSNGDGRGSRSSSRRREYSRTSGSTGVGGVTDGSPSPTRPDMARDTSTSYTSRHKHLLGAAADPVGAGPGTGAGHRRSATHTGVSPTAASGSSAAVSERGHRRQRSGSIGLGSSTTSSVSRLRRAGGSSGGSAGGSSAVWDDRHSHTLTPLNGANTSTPSSASGGSSSHSRKRRPSRTTLVSLTDGSPDGTAPGVSPRVGGVLPSTSASRGSSNGYGRSPRTGVAESLLARVDRMGDTSKSASSHSRTAGAGGGAGAGSGPVRAMIPGGSSSKQPRGLVGLYNLGNTCFMNSTLQCLSNTSLLTNYFLSNGHEGAINKRSRTKGRLAVAFAGLVSRMWRASGGVSAERPQDVKKVVGQVASRFIGYDQQDAQEFLHFFLDALHEDLNRVRSPPKYEEINDDDNASDQVTSQLWWDNYCKRNMSVVTDLFAGQLCSVLVCGVCGYKSRAFDPFWDLSVPIPKSSQVKERRFGMALNFGSGSSESNVKCGIEQCLEAFCAPETLAGSEAAYCKKCKEHRSCTKQMHVFRCPPVLVIHVKRFSYSMFRRDKLTTCISFPTQGLDLSPYCAETAPESPGTPMIYDLIGVSNHMGGLGGGHYTADCLNQDDQKWHCFNDSRVSQTSSSRLSGSAAYMLFYQRRGYSMSNKGSGAHL